MCNWNEYLATPGYHTVTGLFIFITHIFKNVMYEVMIIKNTTVEEYNTD